MAQLAYLLRELLLGAGLTYRKLEKVAHYDHTVLCRAASGVTVPTWKVAQAFVQGCLNAGGVTTDSALGKCILATVEEAWAAAVEAQIVAVEAQIVAVEAQAVAVEAQAVAVEAQAVAVEAQERR